MPDFRYTLAKITGQLAGNFSRWLRFGQGSVLPGRVALLLSVTILRRDIQWVRRRVSLRRLRRAGSGVV